LLHIAEELRIMAGAAEVISHDDAKALIALMHELEAIAQRITTESPSSIQSSGIHDPVDL
jgi:hypothetical protein